MKAINVLLSYFALASSAMAWGLRPSSAPEAEMEDITNGVEMLIQSSLLKEMNPLIFNVVELVLTQMDLPLPPSQIPIGPLGTLKVFFDDTRCHGVRVDKTAGTTGVFFDTDLVGLTFKMDIKCMVNFSTNLRFLKSGTANITINGVNPFAELGLIYLNDSKQLTPVLKTFDIKFVSIDAAMDRHPFANIFLKVFHHMLPPIVSFSMKGIVKALVPRISGLLLDPKIGIPNNHGTVDQYHVVINEAPVLTKQFVKFNVSIDPGDGNAFTTLKDESKKSPFELYLQGYQDGDSGNFYRVQGLDLEKDFKDELKANQINVPNFEDHDMEKRPNNFRFSNKLDQSLHQNERRPQFTEKYEENYEERPGAGYDSKKTYKYF